MNISTRYYVFCYLMLKLITYKPLTDNMIPDECPWCDKTFESNKYPPISNFM